MKVLGPEGYDKNDPDLLIFGNLLAPPGVLVYHGKEHNTSIEMYMAVKPKNAKMADSTRLDLRSRRMKRGLSLEQIAETTKISIRFLRAIEAEEFKELPGGIFSTSYLKQYAAAIQFDEAQLLSCYESAMAASPTLNVVTGTPPQRGLLRWLRVPVAAGR